MTRFRAHTVAQLLASSVLLCAAGARASDVELGLQDCPELSESALREHVDLELKTLGLSQSDVRLHVRCTGGAAIIELWRASGPRYPVEVRVELRATARGARERLVALAATELVAQAERARDTPGETSAPRVELRPAPGPPRDEPVAMPRVAPRRASELFVAGSAALDGEPATVLWGGSLGALLGLGHGYSLLLDTRFERGDKDLPLARVRWSVLSGFVGPALRAELGPLVLFGSLGVRAGWLALSADASAPDEGRDLTAPWAGAALPLRLTLPLGRGVAPFVGVEGGYVVLPVKGVAVGAGGGSETILIEQRGPWLAGSAGLSVML